MDHRRSVERRRTPAAPCWPPRPLPRPEPADTRPQETTRTHTQTDTHNSRCRVLSQLILARRRLHTYTHTQTDTYNSRCSLLLVARQRLKHTHTRTQTAGPGKGLFCDRVDESGRKIEDCKCKIGQIQTEKLTVNSANHWSVEWWKTLRLNLTYCLIREI